MNLTDSAGNAVPAHAKGLFAGDGFALSPDASEVILYKSTTGSSTATAGKIKFSSRNDAGTAMPYAEIEGIGEGSTGLTTANGAYLHVTGSSNLLANFISSDGIGEIRVGDSSKYTRLLTAGNQFKIMPFDGVELMVLDGSTEKVGIGTNAPSPIVFLLNHLMI